MPHTLQKVCLATPVLNVYVARSSLPLTSSKRSGGTIRCRMPFLVQMEQLHTVTPSRSAVTRKRTRPQWHPPCIVFIGSRLLTLAEQAELRRIACGLGEPQVPERMAGEQAPARRALDQALLDQERLDDLLDRVARFRQRRRDGLDPDRPAAIVERDGREIAPIHGVEAGAVDLERDQRLVDELSVDLSRLLDMSEVAHATQQPPGDARRAAGAAGDLVRAFRRHADAEHARAAVDDQLELGLGVEVEPDRNAEAVAQRVGQEPGARRRADQGELGEIDLDRARRRSLADDQVA